MKEVEVKKVEVKEEGVIGSRSDDNIGNDRGNEPSNNLEVEFKKDDSYQGNDLDDIDPDSSPIISEVEALGGGKELKEDSKKASVTGGYLEKQKRYLKKEVILYLGDKGFKCLCYIIIFLILVAGVTGLEPAASCVTGRRSNQLSYTPNILILIN